MTDQNEHFSARPASEDDVEQILKIENVSYPLPWKKEAFLEELKKPFSHVIVFTDDETDSVIAGYIVFWIMFEECTIHNITVNLDYRGLQFGLKLIEIAKKEALRSNCKKLVLEVRKGNDAAIKLYQKSGFFIDHIKKGFYENGEDAYFMTLFIDQKNEF